MEPEEDQLTYSLIYGVDPTVILQRATKTSIDTKTTIDVENKVH